MSRIYDALIEAGKGHDPTTVLFGNRGGNARAEALGVWWRDLSLESKIVGTVAAVVLVFGLFLLAIAHQLVGRALRYEIDQRAATTAINLADAAAGHVIGKNVLELYALLTKYARLDGAAYAFVEDGNGQIVAHSMKPFPPELKRGATPGERKQLYKRAVTFQGKTVYETSVPMLEGQLGAVHLGMWADAVQTKINGGRLPFLGVVTCLLLLAVAVVVYVVRALIASIIGGGEPADEPTSDELKAAASATHFSSSPQ